VPRITIIFIFLFLFCYSDVTYNVYT